MSTFKVTRRELRLEFTVKTTSKVTSYRGTMFVPNRCETTVYNGEVTSFILSQVDENGWGVDDPAGPDGAELNVSYGGGELDMLRHGQLPKVAQDALATIEAAI